MLFSLKIARNIVSALVAFGALAEGFPGEVINTCALVDNANPIDLEPYDAGVKRSRANLAFLGGPGDSDAQVLDILNDYGIKASFFLYSDDIDSDEKVQLVHRMVDEGHSIGSKGTKAMNLRYTNDTAIAAMLEESDERFEEVLGHIPKIFFPSFGSIDNRGRGILEKYGKTIVLWNSGANSWWLAGNGIDLNTSVAVLRYTLPEAGGVMALESGSVASNGVLAEMLNQIMPFWEFVDFLTCIDRLDVDDGMVFATYEAYNRAVKNAAKRNGGAKSGKSENMF